MRFKSTVYQTVAILIVALLASTVFAGWGKVSKNMEYTGKNIIANQGELDVKGPLKIDGAELTASASELNATEGRLDTLESAEPGYIFVGSASSNAEPVVMSGDGSLDNAGALTLTDDYALLTQVWGSATVTSTTNVKESVATITANDVAGSAAAGLRLLRIWISETDLGSASTNNIETLVLSTGTAVSTETANADYYYVTAAAGTAIATITGTAAGTNYLMVADGSTVSSGTVVFE